MGNLFISIIWAGSSIRSSQNHSGENVESEPARGKTYFYFRMRKGQNQPKKRHYIKFRYIFMNFSEENFTRVFIKILKFLSEGQERILVIFEKMTFLGVGEIFLGIFYFMWCEQCCASGRPLNSGFSFLVAKINSSDFQWNH